MTSPDKACWLPSLRAVIASVSIGALMTAAGFVYVATNDIMFGHPPWAVVIFFPGIVAGNVAYQFCGIRADPAINVGCVAAGAFYGLATLLVVVVRGRLKAKR